MIKLAILVTLAVVSCRQSPVAKHNDAHDETENQSNPRCRCLKTSRLVLAHMIEFTAGSAAAG